MEIRLGEKYNRWTIIGFDENNSGYIICQCDCSKTKRVKKSHLLSGCSKSCGCLQKEKVRKIKYKHGLYQTRLYKTWNNMKSRCYNPKTTHYYLYGGKGIKVCEEWKKDFISFYNWAMKNGYKEGLTIDRIDSDKNYCPENCRWATYKEQNSHLKYTEKIKIKPCVIEYNGEKMNLTEWANKLGMNPKTLHARYERGWSIERMLNTPTIKEIKRGDNGQWKLS